MELKLVSIEYINKVYNLTGFLVTFLHIRKTKISIYHSDYE